MSSAADHPPSHSAHTSSSYTSYDGETFGYITWNAKSSSKNVIIGTHGINGAASDYQNLATYLAKHKSNTALYAHNTRGQGLDNDEQRRGHIDHPSSWYRDLEAFTQIVRNKHPAAKVIWMGESMGALICTHALANLTKGQRPSCDALILSSPVTHLDRHIQPWQQSCFHFIASLLPHYKIELEALSKDTQVQVSKDTVHSEQATTNDYHVPAHSLGLISTLGQLIRTMPAVSPHIALPTLILHGGRDYFSTESEIKQWQSTFAKPHLTKREFYPEAYHLLMYDDLRETVFADIASWIS